MSECRSGHGDGGQFSPILCLHDYHPITIIFDRSDSFIVPSSHTGCPCLTLNCLGLSKAIDSTPALRAFLTLSAHLDTPSPCRCMSTKSQSPAILHRTRHKKLANHSPGSKIPPKSTGDSNPSIFPIVLGPIRPSISRHDGWPQT